MRKIRGRRAGSGVDVVAMALLATIAGLPGCGGEERGPTLAGGREVKSWVADLHDPKPQVRRRAVLKLGNVGDLDPTAAEGLADALQDPDALVRQDAVRAVVKLTKPGALIKERLESMSRTDQDPTTRDLAKKALARKGGIE